MLSVNANAHAANANAVHAHALCTQAVIPFSPLLKRQVSNVDPLKRMDFKFSEFDETLSKLSVHTSFKQVSFCVSWICDIVLHVIQVSE